MVGVISGNGTFFWSGRRSCVPENASERTQACWCLITACCAGAAIWPLKAVPRTTTSIEPGSSASSACLRGSFTTSAGCIRFAIAFAASSDPLCADLDVLRDRADEARERGDREALRHLLAERADELLLARVAVQVVVRVTEPDEVERLLAGQALVARLQVDVREVVGVRARVAVV